MALSEHDQKQLDGMEQLLASEDRRLRRMMDGFGNKADKRSSSRARLRKLFPTPAIWLAICTGVVGVVIGIARCHTLSSSSSPPSGIYQSGVFLACILGGAISGYIPGLCLHYWLNKPLKAKEPRPRALTTVNSEPVPTWAAAIIFGVLATVAGWYASTVIYSRAVPWMIIGFAAAGLGLTFLYCEVWRSKSRPNTAEDEQ